LIDIVHAQVDDRALADLRQWVTPADLAAARRVLRRSDRARVLVRRALTRLAIAEWFDVDPGEVVLTRRCPRCGASAHGVPVVERPTGRKVAVSVSSSGTRAVVALTGDRRIGVDLELLTTAELVDFREFSVFSDPERALLHRDPEPHRRQRGLEMWVRKESVGKCLGLGLVADLDQHACSQPGVGWVPTTAGPDPIVYRDVPAPPDAVCAVATDRPCDVRVRGAAFLAAGLSSPTRTPQPAWRPVGADPVLTLPTATTG
jgi:4'-phosphopantetheinyl transferase